MDGFYNMWKFNPQLNQRPQFPINNNSIGGNQYVNTVPYIQNFQYPNFIGTSNSNNFYGQQGRGRSTLTIAQLLQTTNKVPSYPTFTNPTNFSSFYPRAPNVQTSYTSFNNNTMHSNTMIPSVLRNQMSSHLVQPPPPPPRQVLASTIPPPPPPPLPSIFRSNSARIHAVPTRGVEVVENPQPTRFPEMLPVEYYSFELRPCRRLHAQFSSTFPGKLSRKPYKYILKMVSDSPRVGNIGFFLTKSDEIEKFSITVNGDDFNPKLLRYQRMKTDGVKVKYFRRVRRAEKDENDNMFVKHEHYFEIQFLGASSSKTKTFYRVNIQNIDLGKVVYTSSPFLLYVRKSSGENKFWDDHQESNGEVKDDTNGGDPGLPAVQAEDNVTGEKRPREELLFFNGGGSSRKKRKVKHIRTLKK